jgi:hypothetical protein
MRGRTLETRTLSASCVRPEPLHWLQSIDSVRRGHFADCPFELSVQTGGGHSPPLGAVRPSVRPPRGMAVNVTWRVGGQVRKEDGARP